jgi:hypothetical protein
MMENDGELKKIETDEGDKLIAKFGALAPVVKTGDTFSIRGCKFTVSKITDTGIEAVCLGLSDAATAKFHSRPAEVCPSSISPSLPRNSKCFCGSGKKYKKCCLGKN